MVKRSRLTNHCPTHVAVTLGDVAGKAIGPTAQPCGLWDDLQLILVIGNNLRKLVLDVLGLDWLPTDFGQSLGGRFELASLDIVSRGLGKEEETGGQNDGPEELDGDRDSVRAGVIAVLSCINDAVGQQDTDGDAELIPCHDGATYSFGCDFLQGSSECLISHGKSVPLSFNSPTCTK